MGGGTGKGEGGRGKREGGFTCTAHYVARLMARLMATKALLLALPFHSFSGVCRMWPPRAVRGASRSVPSVAWCGAAALLGPRCSEGSSPPPPGATQPV